MAEKAKTGGHWTSKLYFDPDTGEPSSQRHEIGNEALIHELKRLVVVDEEIKEVILYKLPLTNVQLTQFLIYHNFVLFKTQSWWWTIEKNSEGIIIQRSKFQHNVKDYLRREKRIPGMRIEVADSGKKSVRDLIEWLYKENELNKPYNLCGSNCQGFGRAAFNFLAKNEKIIHLL